jgi:ubiquinone/menaquinone biosynthesis C-methylase UbiE
MTTAEGVERQPHANKNMPLRALKARKIEALLGLDSVQAAGQLLEVGTGSGGIAHYFACHAHVSWQVSAVDVVDNRQVMEGYDFQLVSGCKLPFPDASFDVVISNHVIEHVGDAYSQLSHLEELRRVLKP